VQSDLTEVTEIMKEAGVNQNNTQNKVNITKTSALNADKSLKSSSAGKMTSNHSNFASKTPTKQIEQEYLTNTQKFYDEYFNRSSDNDLDNQSNKSLSTHGALELSKNYHESVDELLKLCDEVTEAAGNSIEEQGVSKNESCDPVGEDMFKRKVDHSNRQNTSKKPETEYDLDKITKAIYDKEYGEPTESVTSISSPRTPFRKKSYSGKSDTSRTISESGNEMSYSEFSAIPKKPVF